MPLRAGPPTIIMNRMTSVPKSLLLDVESEKTALTLPNRAKLAAAMRGFKKEGPDYYYLYQETEHHLLVPRAHTVRLRRDLSRKDHWSKVCCIDLIKPREPLGQDLVHLGPNEFQPFNQQPAFDALMAGPAWPYGKVLALRCGAGKTVIALKAAHHRGGNMLWVTTSTTLMEDMLGERKGIPKWLGIHKKDIEQVQGKGLSPNWRTRRCGVAMLHTISECVFPQEFYDHWDLVIFDEADMMGAAYFARSVSLFRAERWALTATVKRADAMEPMYLKHIGPVVYEHLEHDMKPECTFFHHDSDPSCLIRSGWDVAKGEQRVSFQATAKALLMNERRNKAIYDLIDKATRNDGRTVLVLGDSVEGLAVACQGAREALPHLSHGLIVGAVPQKKRDEILQGNQVVWATTKLGARGLDRPAFDTVIVVSLITVNEPFWTQVTGRILRFLEGKPLPVVVVITDTTIGPVMGLCGRLANFFKKMGWKRNGEQLVREHQRNRQLELKMQEEQ